MQCSLFTNRIREIRKAKKLTLADVSERTGVSIAYLSDIERGNRNGSEATRQRIAGVLNVSVDDLKGGASDGAAS
jgi:transcriptional regulator with XRE-family HTH domain